MSAVANQRRQGPVIGGAIVAAVVLAAVSYVLLVHRERVAADQALAQAEHLEAELSRGRAWLASRPDDKLTVAEVERVGAEVARRIPVGRNDLLVAQYLEGKAAENRLYGFKYEVSGGIALPEDRPAKEKTAAERLAVDPQRLQSVSITLTFSARYRDLLAFTKAIAEAPWLVEIAGLELQRLPKQNEIQAKVTTRYLYQ